MALDWSLPFELMCNVRDIAVGVVVLGQRKDKIMLPVYIHHQDLNKDSSKLHD